MPQEQENAYRKALSLQNSGQRYPALDLVRANPKVAAVLSKLTLDRRMPITHDGRGNRVVSNMQTQDLRGIASSTAQNIVDAEQVTQMLPDIDLSAQILVSAILSPKDMMGCDPSYVSQPGRWPLPSQTNASLINAAREYLDQVYKIKTLLPDMLHDILFRTGSYPIAVIPENSVDEIINGTGEIKMESLLPMLDQAGHFKGMGILGPLDKDATKPKSARQGFGYSAESLFGYQPTTQSDPRVINSGSGSDKAIDFNITVTDNINLLKMPEITKRAREIKIRALIGGRTMAKSKLTVESLNVSDQGLSRALYQIPKTQFTNMAIMKSQDRLARRSVGNPLLMHFPSEAVLPVHVPNRPDDQIGFFVLLDTEGNPISRNQSQDYYREMGARLAGQDSFASSMIQRSKQSLGDNSQHYNHQQVDFMSTMYQQMLEDDLLQRVRNGITGGNVKLAENHEIYRIMMARSLSNQHTQLLYIPAEFMTYMALRYSQNGIGKSLLDDGKILTSMRCMLLVANLMTSLRNSIGRTQVNVKLDELTPDPEKAIEQIMGEIMRVNSAGLPLGTTNPMDIKDAFQRAQFQFAFTGHPGLPEMSIDFEARNDNYPKPDLELEKLLRDRMLQLFGLTPEMVDASSGADFAQSVMNNAVLMSKRVLTTQQKFTPQVSDNIRKVLMNSADAVDKLTAIINDSLDDIIKALKKNHEDDKISMGDGTIINVGEIKDNALYRQTFITEILEDFISNFELQLPAPDLTKTDNQNDAYEKFETLLDKALNAWITNDLLDSTQAGEAGTHANMIRESVKAYFLREFQIQNGILPSLTKLTSTNEDGNPELDFASILPEHTDILAKLIGDVFKNGKKTREKVDKILEKAGAGEGNSEAGSGGDDGSSGGWDDGNGDDGGVDGMDDMGDLSMDDTADDGTSDGGEDTAGEEPAEATPEPAPAAEPETTEPEEPKES